MITINLKKGFTLLEILLVIALIGILASIIIVAINPTRQLAQARNFQRQGHIKTINDAVSQYIVKTGDTPEGLAGWYKDICPVGGGSNCVDLSVLIPDYLSEIPTEPDGTPYQIALNTTTNKLSLRSGEAELGAEIVMSPLSPVTTFAKRTGSNNFIGTEIGEDVKVLPNGDTVVVGSFAGEFVTFGEGESNATTLSTYGTSGYSDIFLAKYNNSGNLIWVKGMGGDASDWGNAIDTDSNGNIFITGTYQNAANFGQGNVPCATWSQCTFTAKYDPNGILIWVKAAVSSRNYSYDITVLPDGGVAVIGQFEDNITFGQGEPTARTLINAGGGPIMTDIFIAKYNANGTFAWAKRAGSTGYDVGRGVVSISDTGMIATGYFSGTVVFGQGEPTSFSLTSSGLYDLFIVKYNSDGTVAWAKRAGGNGWDFSSDIGILDTENILITGNFDDGAIFGQGEVNEVTLSTSGESNIFIARYNSTNGNLVWSKQSYGNQGDTPLDIATFNDKSSIITGFIGDTTIFGQGESNQTTLDCNSGPYGRCMFIAKYDSNGFLVWARQAGEGEDTGSGVDTYIDGSIIVTGDFYETISFERKNGLSIDLISAGEDDMFIAKLNPDGLLE